MAGVVPCIRMVVSTKPKNTCVLGSGEGGEGGRGGGQQGRRGAGGGRGA